MAFVNETAQPTGILLIELQADFQLANGFIGCAEGFDAVSAEVMSGVFHVLFRAA